MAAYKCKNRKKEGKSRKTVMEQPYTAFAAYKITGKCWYSQDRMAIIEKITCKNDEKCKSICNKIFLFALSYEKPPHILKSGG